MNTIRVSVLAALLVLQGCSSMKAPNFVPADPETLSEWSVEGSVTIKNDGEKQETFFEYKNIQGEYEIALRPESPVGETGAVVKGTEGETDVTTTEAKNPQAEKIAAALKDTLPVGNMSYWLRALPASGDARLEREDNVLAAMEEDGWEIKYDSYMQVSRYQLPEKISLNKSGTEVEINLVRAETGYLSDPCPASYMPDDSVSTTEGNVGGDVIRTLVPPSGEAPLPRWINDQDFCRQLIKLHGKVPDPRIGLFGPGSMYWKLSAPAAPAGMGAGRALLLQTAHPWITAGIDDHSIVRYDPVERARRTFIGINTIIYGSMPQVMAAANTIHKSHNEIQGKIPYPAGAFKENSEYRANEVAAMIWVHATLWETLVTMYEKFNDPLTQAEKDRFYEETKLFAMVFGIPESALPRSWDEFMDYNQTMWYSPQLTVTDNARTLKEDLFDARSIWLVLPLWIQETVTSVTLPTPVAEGYGMKPGFMDKLNYQWMMASAGLFDWIMPDAIRENPIKFEAEARLRGERAGAFTRQAIKTGLGFERLVN